MEYEDELERMRDRRRRQKARGQQHTPDSPHPRQGTGQEADMVPIRSQGTRRRPSDSGGQRQRGQYDDDYGYERRRSRSRRGYDDHHYNNRDDYDDDEVYGYDDDEVCDYDDRRGYGEYGDGYDYDNGRRGQGRRSGKTQKKKKHKSLLLKILLLIVVLAGAYLIYKYKQTGTGYWTVAVFGVDSRDGNLEKGALSDVEMICVIDRGTGDITLVSVFRDTYLEINPDGTYHKINEAYFKGGHEQAIQALERNLDLSIDDYATFNWKAVADAINILGGIDLEISDSEFKFINSFITETVESTGIGSYHLEHAGMNHLDGIQAVAYARLRLMDTDYNRTARQRLVIQLAMDKAKKADLKTLTTLVRTILPQISTSIGVDDVLPMARNISKFHIGETNGFPFSRGETYIGKKDCIIPLTLESNVIQLHQILYGTEAFQPSGTVKKISAQIASDSGMGQVAENAPEAKVLGQKALESQETEDSGNPGQGGGSGDNPAGGNSAGSSGDPVPPSQPEAVPAQTEAVQDEPAKVPEESPREETSTEGSPSSEEVQDETGIPVPPSEETEIGPESTQPEPEPEPTQPETSAETSTETQAEPPAMAPAEKPAEETPEVGPGVS